jgi:hypothetical protein
MSRFSVIFSSFLGGEYGLCDPAKSEGKMTKPKAFCGNTIKREGNKGGQKKRYIAAKTILTDNIFMRLNFKKQ